MRKRGTLEIEAEIKRLKQENEKLDEIILQTRNETRQDRERMRLDRERMKLENEKLDEIILQTRNETKRLSELESKLDGLFSKYNINPPAYFLPEIYFELFFGDATVKVGFGKVWINANGFIVVRDGSLIIFEFFFGDATVIVGFGKVWINANGFTVVRDGSLIIFEFIFGDATVKVGC